MRKVWKVSTLGSVCLIKPPKKEARDRLSPSDMVSFVPMNDLGIGEKGLKARERRPLEAVTGSYTYFADGDVLLAKITPCFENGKLGIAGGLTNGVGFGSSEFIVLRPNDSLNAEYLFYFLSQDSFRDAGASVMSGAVGHKRVPREFIENVPIPLPPLPEQERIVAILDEAFAGIATAVANTERNLANASELFESYLKAVLSQRGDGWEDKRLREICTLSSGGTPSKKKASYWDGDIPWISGRDMKSTRLSDSVLHVSEAAVKESSTRIAPVGTILVLVRGMGLAHGAQLAELLAPCAFNQDIRGVHPNANIEPRYLLFALRDRINSNDRVLRSAAHGTLKLDSTELVNLMIPVPPGIEQRKIVLNIDRIGEESIQLKAICQQKRAALAELKQSLLEKAFSGGLTALPQDEIETVLA